MPTRTSHRSTTGTKLSAKRNAKGQITDIQTYKRAHGQDIKRSSRPSAPRRHLRSQLRSQPRNQ